MRNIRIIPMLLSTILVSSQAFAVGSSGFENATLSARSLGRGNAAVADANDASVLAFNPAGLSKLNHSEINVGANFLSSHYVYEGAEGRPDEGSSETIFPIPFGYAAIPTPIDGFVIGVGANSPFGLATKNSSTGNFKYSAYFNSLVTNAYHISAGYALADNFSFGAGWTHMELSMKQVGKFNRNLVAGTTADATFEYEVGGQGQGWNVGMLYEVSNVDTLGLFYRSEVRTHLKGWMNTHDLNGGLAAVFGTGSNNHTSADTDVSLPANITLGYKRLITESFDIEVDIGWTGWGSYDSVKTVYGTSNAVLAGFEVINRDFNDVISVHVGSTYSINNEWKMNSGYYFQDMAGNILSYSNEIPDGDRHGFTIGFEKKIDNWTLDFTYLYAISGEVDANNISGVGNLTDIDGNYSGVIQGMTVGLRTKFE